MLLRCEECGFVFRDRNAGRVYAWPWHPYAGRDNHVTINACPRCSSEYLVECEPPSDEEGAT